MSWSMEGIRSGLFRGGVRGRPRGSTPLLDGVGLGPTSRRRRELDVTGGSELHEQRKAVVAQLPHLRVGQLEVHGARALEISDRQRSSATLDGLGRPAKVRRTSVMSATGIPPRSDNRNDGRVAVHTRVEITVSRRWRGGRRGEILISTQVQTIMSPSRRTSRSLGPPRRPCLRILKPSASITKNSSRNRRSALRTFTTGDGGRRRIGVPRPRGSDGDRTVAATRNVRGAVVGDAAARCRSPRAALLLAGRLSGAQAAAAGDGARASIGHGPWRGGELGGGSGQSYPREMDGDAGSSEVVPVMYDSAVHDCWRMMPAARQQWARRCPSPRPQSKDSIIGPLPPPRQPASRLCFATTEWPLRGQQALRQPRNCTAVGLMPQCSWARGAEAAHEARASLWRESGAVLEEGRRGPARRQTQNPPLGRVLPKRDFVTRRLPRSADHQTCWTDVCAAAVDTALSR